ncbi:RSPO4 protein, partial [Piprites chloris]|nr:RSPO4 protein [Piprites chloris]
SAGLLENCTPPVLCWGGGGCITCHHRLFLLIWRDGIRQYGMCVHTCPPGPPGVRGGGGNRCTSTSPSCESCFPPHFCMGGGDKFYLYKGQCFPPRPPRGGGEPGTRECQGGCEPGPWSEWSAPPHESGGGGCKWGVETRVRAPPEAAGGGGAACPALQESRTPPMKKGGGGGEHRVG